jgi:putative ABC transport system permease protein
MFLNYLLTSLRVLVRNRLTSLINVGGLAAGIAASMLIILYVKSELSVDRFNEHYENIYRLEVGDFHVTGTAQALLLNELPEVKKVARMDFRYSPLVKKGDEFSRIDKFLFADSTLFDIFTFNFLYGNPRTALADPFSLVLSRSVARIWFGGRHPVGETLSLDNHEYTVTAVFDDVGEFHLPMGAIGSFSTLPVIENDADHDRYLYNYMNFLTYVLLYEHTDPAEASASLDRMIDELYPGMRRYESRLRKMGDIYFNRGLDDSPPVRHGNLPLVYTLIAIAGFILLIAIVNFINMATANASARSPEIGIRKVVGAQRWNLVFQFLAESVIISFFAFLIAMVLVELLLPVFNDLLLTSLSFQPFRSLLLFILLLSLVIFTGILAGIYPAFYLSSLKTLSTLKGVISAGKSALTLRRFLIIFQFTISIALIISTLTIYRQIEYIRGKDLGFEKQNVLIARLNRDLYSSPEVLRQQLLENESVIGVSFSNNRPGFVTWFNTWETQGESKPHKFLPVDPYYIPLMGIQMVSGRNFEWARLADQELTYILNEEAVRYFGFDEPSGKEFMVGHSSPVRIIGVVKDFHYRSLHEPVGPLVLGWQPGSLGLANIRIKEDNIEHTIEFIRLTWNELSPGHPFEFAFLDDEIDRLYGSEIRVNKLFRYFALFAIIIACLGLYGLSTFIMNKRSREIGIRKVLGSGSGSIILRLISEFVKLVAAANLIAWPVAYLAMAKWLVNFPYRIDQELWVFAFSGMAALVITLVTVSLQAWKTAAVNPAVILRNE